MPTILLTGTDLYFRDKALAELRERLVDPGMASLSHKKLTSPHVLGLIEAIGSVGMSLFGGLGNSELIEVHQFSPLSQALKDTNKKDDVLGQLKSLLAELPDAKTVVFIADKVDRKVSFAKWITTQSFCQHQAFDPLPFWKLGEATSLLVREAKALGIALKHDAAEALVDTYGTTFYPLMNEVRKLGVYARDTGGTGRPVTKTDVLTLCHSTEGLFALLDDWLKQNNPDHVFQSLDDILLKDPPVRIYAAIQSYLLTQHRLKLWQAQRLSSQTMAERLGKKPFAITENLKKLGPVSLERLSLLQHKAIAMEAAMKSGQLPDRLSLEMLLAS